MLNENVILLQKNLPSEVVKLNQPSHLIIIVINIIKLKKQISRKLKIEARIEWKLQNTC